MISGLEKLNSTQDILLSVLMNLFHVLLCLSIQKIEYTALQLGELDSMCFVPFTKKKENINEIMGQIEVYREKHDPASNSGTENTGEKKEAKLRQIAVIPFSNTMCDIPQSGMLFPEKLKLNIVTKVASFPL